MALPIIISRNTLQEPVGSGQIESGRVTNADTGLYTVPAGKKAIMVIGKSYVDTVSGDATYALAIKIGATWIRVGDSVPVNKISSAVNIVMATGTIVGYIGDNGDTTATIDMYAQIREQDA